MTKFALSFAACFATLATSASAATQAELEAQARKGMGLIAPYIILMDSSHVGPYTDKDPNSAQGRADLREGIALLETVTSERPDFWAGFVLIAKAHQTRGEHVAAYQALRQAYGLHPPDQSGVSREYALEALCTHHDDEAVTTARQDAAAHPDNAILASNLGFILLGVGQLDGAEAATRRSLKLAPTDPVTQRQLRDIAGARTGTVVPRRCFP